MELRMEGGGVLLTSREVSEQLGVDQSRIRQLCKAGRFPGAFLLSNRWFIPQEGFDEYQKHPDRRRKKAGG